MANEVFEMAVKVTPENIEETTEELREHGQQFDDTAKTAEDSANKLTKFAKKWRGAGLVFAGAFTSMVGAVASKVPVFDQAASEFDILLTSMGLRMDELVRGPMKDVREEVRETTKEVNEAENPLIALTKGFIGAADAAIEFGEVPFDAFFDFILGLEEGENLIDDRLIPALESIPSIVSSMFQSAKRTVIDEFINPIIGQINRMIRKANKLPGVDIGELTPVNIPDPGTPDVPETGGGEDFGHSGGLGGTGTITVQTNIGRRKVAEETKQFNVRGVLSRRGLPGE